MDETPGRPSLSSSSVPTPTQGCLLSSLVSGVCCDRVRPTRKGIGRGKESILLGLSLFPGWTLDISRSGRETADHSLLTSTSHSYLTLVHHSVDGTVTQPVVSRNPPIWTCPWGFPSTSQTFPRRSTTVAGGSDVRRGTGTNYPCPHSTYNGTLGSSHTPTVGPDVTDSPRCSPDPVLPRPCRKRLKGLMGPSDRPVPQVSRSGQPVGWFHT